MDALDKSIKSCNAGAYVAYASSGDPDMRYLTRFRTSDPIVYIKKPGEQGIIIIPQMELEHALRESIARPITRADAGLPEILKRENNLWKATALMIENLTEGDLLIPPRFPVALSDELRKSRTVTVDKGTVEEIRAIKSDEEITKIRAIQYATDEGMKVGISIIRKSVSRKGRLYFHGKLLTSERVRREIHKRLMDFGARGLDTIVSCGNDTAIPHMEGSGPLLEMEPIIIDIFPQDESTGYVADMTRTVSKGEPDAQIREMYSAVQDAQDLAARHAVPGKTGAELYQETVDLFNEHGFDSGTRGFIHSLGHGVGLAVHELPSLSPSGGLLSAGNVITIEPGLYYPGIGGVRIEDMGIVTRKGFDRLTDFSRDLVI